MEAAEYFGNRPIVVGRELTKIHQEFLRGTAQEVADRLGAPRGEFTVVVGPGEAPSRIEPSPISDEQLAAEFGQDRGTAGLRRREAVARLARRYGRPVRDVYAAIERGKK
jgi:16S rRNA (cytidine1402-2'-O)-methyltransferase